AMGQTAEILAHRFGISRENQDAYALQSHRRLSAWFDGGYGADEIEVLYESSGVFRQEDTAVRRDTDLAQLARLKPAFDRKYGQVTPGNSASIADGAALLVMASETAVRRYQL